MTAARSIARERGHASSRLVLRELRRAHFAVLSTTGPDGASHSAGVSYGMALTGEPLTLYVMTRTHLRKARDIAHDPRVSLVVPIARRVLWPLPPATIQLLGRAEIVDANDPTGNAVFESFWIGRQILEAYRRLTRGGERRVCFLKISPDPVVRTYMLGQSVWEIRERMESGAGTVVLSQR